MEDIFIYQEKICLMGTLIIMTKIQYTQMVFHLEEEPYTVQCAIS